MKTAHGQFTDFQFHWLALFFTFTDYNLNPREKREILDHQKYESVFLLDLSPYILFVKKEKKLEHTMDYNWSSLFTLKDIYFFYSQVNTKIAIAIQSKIGGSNSFSVSNKTASIIFVYWWLLSIELCMYSKICYNTIAGEWVKRHFWKVFITEVKLFLLYCFHYTVKI